MKFKSFIIYAITLSFISSCVDVGNGCQYAEALGIQFTTPYEYVETDTLQIDDLKFTHVTYQDSLKLGNYIPNKSMVLLEVSGKQAKEKSNSITIGMVLAKKLKRTGRYNILNGAEILTTGKVRISRKDGKKIKVCTPQGYNAVLLE